MTHAAADPTAVAAKVDPTVTSPNQPNPGQVIRLPKADLRVGFLSHGANGNTTVDTYELQNLGPTAAQSVSLEKVCVFKSQGGEGSHAISTQTSTVELGTVANGAAQKHSVTCTPPQGKFVLATSMRAHSPTPDPSPGNESAGSI